MRRHIKTFLGYLLTITLIFSDLSIVAYAEESAGTTTEQTVTADSESADAALETEDTIAEPEIISELTDKRDEKTKYFAMSDGTIKACIYPQNVHYLEDGKYEEINNTLAETTENDKTYYKNKKNGFSVKIPESFTDDYIEFSDENGYVKFKLQGATNKKIEKIEKEQAKKNTDKTAVNNVNDKAIFKSIKGNIDIEYDLAGNKLKETIVLYKKTKNSFVFDVQTSATSAEVNTDNSISFFDAEGTELYMIASPYMTDSAGEYSNEVETKLIKNKNGYTLTYKPDYEWLSAKGREYPVKIDPTLFQAIYKETVTDTYISNVQTSSNPDIRGYWDVLNIGRRATTISSGTQLTKRGLIRFDIPSEIGKNDCIVDAKLDLVHYTVSNAVSASGIQIDVHELTSGFTEGGTWWGNQPSYDSIITDYAIVNTNNTFSGSTLSYDSYNITKLVNKWHNGGTNYGLMLKLHDEGTTVSSSKQVYYFAKQSTYYGSVSKFVEITYRNATGLEDYWSYTTQDFGEYGIGYVNNYNGNLVYVHEDTSFNSLINGFTLSHVFNSNLSPSTHSVNGIMGYYGRGWNLNLVQKLEPITVTGNSSVKYVYTDGDGTRHYLVQNTDGTIVDEDGLGYTYTDISESDLTRQLTDKNKNRYKFDQWGYLRRIIDSHGNIIYLNYNPIPNVDNYLSSIVTSTGASYHLNYDSNYNLISITDNAERSIQYRYSSGHLMEIEYPDGRILKFLYDTHWMIRVTSPENLKLEYNYHYPSYRIRATKITEPNGAIASNTSIVYSQHQTHVVDSDGRQTTYQFDTWGRPTCVYDNEQNVYNQTYNKTVNSGATIFNNNKLASASNNSVAYVNNLLANPVFSNDLTGWIQYKENANAQISVVSGEGLLTSKSIEITSDGNTIEVIQQSPSISSERTYTFSGYLKTENVESVRHGAALEAVVTGPSGTKQYLSNFILGTTDPTIDNGFQHVSLTFALEEGESLARVTVGLFKASGTVYIDALQLEEGNVANHINMVNNSGFERGVSSSATLEGYVTNFGGSSGNGISTAASRNGNASCKIIGVGTATRSIYQIINTAGKAGDVYTVGGWAKADSIPDYPAFVMHVMAYNGSTRKEHLTFKFNECVSDWQAVSRTFRFSYDYTSIHVYCSYDFNCNVVYFDNLFLYRDTMQSYTYDNDGNVISSADYASQNQAFQYNDNSHLSKLINPTGSSYEYLYDTHENMKTARSAEGVSYDFVYDSQGNVRSTKTINHAYSSSIQSGKTYYIRLKTSGKYLAVEGSGTALNTNVIQETFTGNDNQKWIVEQTTDGYYCLHPAYLQSMSLDVSNGASSTNGNIAIHTNNLTDAQKYSIIPKDDYTYQLKPKCLPERLVTVVSASSQNNVTAHVKEGENNSNQEWYFEDVEQPPATTIEDGVVYQFRARHSGKYVHVLDKGTAQGTAVQQYEQNLESNQRYVVHQYNSTDYYTLSPMHAQNTLLEVSTELIYYDNVGYAYLQLGDNAMTDRKLFKFEYDATKKGFRIIPKYDETVALNVANSSLQDGAGLIFAPIENDANRFFIAEKFSDSITSVATYQNNGNYPHTITDARGNTTTYAYDTDRGLQTGVTDAKGNTTTYVYNALNDRLESVSAGNSTVNYEYETNGALKNITTANGTIYNFIYDVFGRTSNISVGNQKLSEIVYKDNNSTLVKEFKYGNGVSKTYTYDNQDRLISESINGTLTRTYVYDKSGNMASITDYTTNITTTFRYDLIGRTVEIKTSDGQSMNFNYDKFNRLSLSKWFIDNIAFSTSYIYGDNSVDGQTTGLIYGVNLNGIQQLAYQYDELARLKTRTLSTTTPFVTEYGYLEGATANTTTTLVKTVKNGNDKYEYTYDELGNITSVAKNGTIIETYTYDSLGQLTSASYGGNTFTYAYDNGGNITEIKKNDVVIKSYTYGNSEWKDLLTAFDGETITYDKIGNPLTYRNGMNFTWQNGRQLATVTQNGTALATYTYNADGLRTTKTVNGTTTEYYWQNGTLYGQKTGDEYIFFLYDENGIAYGFIIQNGTEKSYYYYEFNLQGDIIGIIDNAGAKVVEYTYGAWGDILSITGTHADTIGQKNPLRYRGYYYDAETGFYYVSSRYYDPEIGRFVNADNAVAGVGGNVNGYNLYSYCFNNPVNMSDPTGNWPKWVSSIGNAVKTVVNTVVNKVKSVASSVKTTILNAAKGNSSSLPTKGEPGSSQTLKNPDGTPKQKRWYGPDGNAERDRDYNHQGNYPFPHDHEWNNGKRGEEHLTPSPAYEFSIEPVLGAALVSACAIGIVVVAADDVTGVGVADDFLFGPLGTGVSTGLIMMLP